MYINSAYLNESLQDFKDNSRPLIVGSCGTYHLRGTETLPTYRPRGRVDFQMLYVASGRVHFFFRGREETVNAGHMVFYRPRELQKYVYYGTDQTEVYWVHFTGSSVKEILRNYGITDDIHVLYSGTSPEYVRLFKQMISELQQCQDCYEELLTMLLHQLFILLRRRTTREYPLKNEYLEHEIELAMQFFNENYNTAISIDDYAASRGMSVSWFIRSFKKYTTVTPMQYIVSLRITNAQLLLETTNYNVNEIGRIVGYDNALYFSRIFKKQRGVSPSEYRKKVSSDFRR